MPRPRNLVRSRRIHIAIPEDILAEVEMHFFNASRDKPIYGIYTLLISELLRKWLADPSILPITIEDVRS